MAGGRPPKKGIDYAGWSVDIFDNNTDIDKLLDAHGWDGFGIYFYLCQRAYGGEGYFYKWGYADCATTARKMGGGIGSGTVKEAVGYCLQIGLFDKRLFDRWGILTSRGIQSRYCEAIKNRDVKKVIVEYWLLQKDEECSGLIKLPLNISLSEGNANFPAGNSSFSEGNESFSVPKESKVKESKVNKPPISPLGGEREKRFTPPTPEEVSAFCRERGNGIDGEEFCDFYASKGWMVGKNKMKNWQATVRTWERKKGFKPAQKPSDHPPEPDKNKQDAKAREEAEAVEWWNSL